MLCTGRDWASSVPIGCWSLRSQRVRFQGRGTQLPVLPFSLHFVTPQTTLRLRLNGNKEVSPVVLLRENR